MNITVSYYTNNGIEIETTQEFDFNKYSPEIILNNILYKKLNYVILQTYNAGVTPGQPVQAEIDDSVSPTRSDKWVAVSNLPAAIASLPQGSTVYIGLLYSIIKGQDLNTKFDISMHKKVSKNDLNTFKLKASSLETMQDTEDSMYYLCGFIRYRTKYTNKNYYYEFNKQPRLLLGITNLSECIGSKTIIDIDRSTIDFAAEHSLIYAIELEPSSGYVYVKYWCETTLTQDTKYRVIFNTFAPLDNDFSAFVDDFNEDYSIMPTQSKILLDINSNKSVISIGYEATDTVDKQFELAVPLIFKDRSFPEYTMKGIYDGVQLDTLGSGKFFCLESGFLYHESKELLRFDYGDIIDIVKVDINGIRVRIKQTSVFGTKLYNIYNLS